VALISLDAAKEYLRVDTEDEDATIDILLSSACRICVDVARLSADMWEAVDSDIESNESYSEEELIAVRETMKVAILYALGYLFEHREEADHHELTLTLRSILFAVREGVV
jgi:hypothetical protein